MEAAKFIKCALVCLLLLLAGCASGYDPGYGETVVPPEGYIPPFETMQAQAALVGLDLQKTGNKADPPAPDSQPEVPLPGLILYIGAAVFACEATLGKKKV